MKIAIVTYSLNYGGVSTFILSLAKIFAVGGNTVKIITTRKKGVWFDKVEIPNVTYTHTGIANSWIYPSVFLSFKISQLLRKEGFELIIVNHSRSALQALSLINYSPFVITVIHNDHDEICKEACVNETMIDSVVAVSPKVHDRALRFMKDSSKLITIFNGIDLESDTNYSNRIDYNPLQQLKIIFVGRIVNAQKGVFLIPLIAKQLKKRGIQFNIEIIGDGSDSGQLKSQIDEMELGSNIQLINYKSHSEVKIKMLESHLLLVPSYFEGLPLNVLEAMTRGCVPVMSKLPQITDVCFEDFIEGVSCESGNSDDFAHAIESFYRGNLDWYSLSKNAREKIKKSFSSQRMANDYLSLTRTRTSKKVKSDFLSNISIVDLIPTKVLELYIKLKNNHE